MTTEPRDLAALAAAGFVDMTLACRDCGDVFVWTAGEQEFFASRQLSRPKRCVPCRETVRAHVLTDRRRWKPEPGQ